MDLIEEYAKLRLHEPPISNTEIYKLKEFYSDITYISSDIYRAFPVEVKQPEKKISLGLFKLTIQCNPYFIIKVEYT